MPTKDKYDQGQFCWYELATTDAKSAKQFYSELLGWSFHDNPMGEGMVYTMCKVGGRDAAGLFGMGAEMRKTMPPSWVSYINVSSADEFAKKAAGNGGKIVKEPFDVMDVGRMAILTDPTGAAFALWQPKKHIGAGVVDDAGAPTWSELMTSDPNKAADFYTKTFGWQRQDTDIGPMGTYTLFSMGSRETSRGGMMKLPPNLSNVPSHWLAYFAVKNCAESTKRVSTLGGKALVGSNAIPNIGSFSIVQDREGATFGLYEHGR